MPHPPVFARLARASFLALLAGALSLGVSQSAGVAGATVRIQPLAPLVGLESSAGFDINEFGRVAGVSYTDNEEMQVTRGVSWKGGRPTHLPLPPGCNYSAAYGLNDRGQLVGEVGIVFGDEGIVQPALWKGNNVTVLGSLPGAYGGYASDITNNGLIIGGVINADVEWTAVTWNKGRITDLGTVAGTTESEAELANERGQVLVNCFARDAENKRVNLHAALWNKKRLAALPELEGGLESNALGLNSKGVAVGWSLDAAGVRHPVAWFRDVADLGIPFNGTSAIATTINDQGDVAGIVRLSPEETHLVLWRNGEPTDLTALIPAGQRWTELDPWHFNDRGQLVGVGKLDGVWRAFVMTIKVRTGPGF